MGLEICQVDFGSSGTIGCAIHLVDHFDTAGLFDVMDFVASLTEFVFEIYADFVRVDVQMLRLNLSFGFHFRVTASSSDVYGSDYFLLSLNSTSAIGCNNLAVAVVSRLDLGALFLMFGRNIGLLHSLRHCSYFVHALEIQLTSALKQL